MRAPPLATAFFLAAKQAKSPRRFLNLAAGRACARRKLVALLRRSRVRVVVSTRTASFWRARAAGMQDAGFDLFDLSSRCCGGVAARRTGGFAGGTAFSFTVWVKRPAGT